MKKLFFCFVLVSLYLSINAQDYQFRSSVNINYPNCIAFQPDIIWYGTNDGVKAISKADNKTLAEYLTYTFSRQKNQYYQMVTDKRSNPVAGIVFDSSNNVWIAVADGTLLKYEKDSLRIIKQNRYYLDSRIANYYYEEGKWVEKFKGYLTGFYSCISIDKNDIIYLGTDKGIEKYDGRIWTQITMKDGLISNTINSICIDINNNNWVGTDKGISKYNGQDWENITDKNGLISNDISVIKSDNKGIVWIGSDKGLTVIDGKKCNNYDKKNGFLKSNRVRAIAIDKDNKVWIGTNKGISSFENGNWNNLDQINGMKNCDVTMIEISPDGLVYINAIGPWNVYLLEYNGNNWKEIYKSL